MRLLLVDDHKMFTESLTMALDRLQKGNTLLVAQSREEALDYASAGQCFEVILLDLHMPGNDGMDNLAVLRKTYDTACIVIVSGETDPRIVFQTIEHGAAGYVSKASDLNTLLEALETVLNGGVALPSKLPRPQFPGALPPSRPPPSHNAVLDALSPRQREALFSAIRGQSNKVIAREMCVTPSTVKHHLAIAFKVLGVLNRTAAVYEANRLQLFPDTESSQPSYRAPERTHSAC
ncbi:response regulator transcription factor [Massilia antarctica]|uniref:Response regulator transcription factor n=1 Tax=Massilia antarctica TaxID=2765360 RepID=A0AA48WAJ7_9BURK|nr:response regulator transcription factor [Massilia antarctica]QPI48953.1 response regulator transcription factor [Massilia antarctica]